MIDTLLSLDTQLFVFLNGLGSSSFDSLWLFITKQTNWTPLFILLLYFIYSKLCKKQLLYVLFFMAVLILFSDQVTNLFKYTFQRLRPCSNPEINTIIRVVKSSSTYSFFSGHAANSMATSVFIYNVLKPFYKHMYILFLWPLIFAYSRIYLGLHYPLDIVCGYLFGIGTGILFFKIYKFAQQKYFPI